MFDRANHCRQIGTLGGQETVRRYGIRYMRELAKAGFQSYADRHHDGNRASAYYAIHRQKPLSFHTEGGAKDR